MGDRTYARIGIPAHFLATSKARVTVAEQFKISIQELDALLAEKPSSDEYGYDNSCCLRLVRGIPCLVWEYDQANYGAFSEEDALAAVGIPFLLCHEDGSQYSAGRTSCSGSRRWSVEVNRQDEIVVAVTVNRKRATIDPLELANVDFYLAAEASVFTPPVQPGRRRRPSRKGH